MKFKILVSACAVFAIFAAQANAKESVNTAPVKLEAVEVNSVGDNISNSGIDEGFLSKNVTDGWKKRIGKHVATLWKRMEIEWP